MPRPRSESVGQNDPWASDPSEDRRRRWDLLSIVPLVAIIALVLLVAGVVWAVSRNETEQARVKLATDALWVEQTLRFQMSVDEDLLARLALEAESGTSNTVLDARSRLHIATNPEMLSVIWYDREGRRLRALPGPGAPGDDELVQLMIQTGQRSTRPVYGDLRPDGSVTMGLARGNGSGFVTATVTLPILLERHIPWWIAEQYGVRIFDNSGREYAARQRLEPAAGSPTHAISFDPPLRGILLGITAYDTPARFRSALLLGVIAALAVFAILALLVLFRNASRRRAAEARWRGETAFRRAVEESLTVGLRAKDHEGRTIYVNSAFCNLVGWKAEELIGRDPPMPYWHPTRVGETVERHRQLKEGSLVQHSFETRFRHSDGHDIDVRVYEAPLIDASGVHRGWMGSVIDLTEQKSADRKARAQEETLARTGRLVTLGEMASTLAHELNQPLSAIASYAAGMANFMDRPDADLDMMRDANSKIARQADRAGRIIRHIQDLVKKREPRFVSTGLDEVVADTLGFLAADAREHRVRLLSVIEARPEVAADRILLEQVLVNLIRNGMEAMAGPSTGETITVTLSVIDSRAQIEVADRGGGISDQMAGRLFEAFASTKSQGMGMGLKICRSVVELHQGSIDFRANPEGGTIFRIRLPLAAVHGTRAA